MNNTPSTIRAKLTSFNTTQIFNRLSKLHCPPGKAYTRSHRPSFSANWRQKRIVRILHIAMIILCFLAMFFPLRQILITYIFILLFLYLLLLILYPKLTLERPKNCDENLISFPFLPGALSMLFLLYFMEIINFEENKWLPMSIILLIILLIPYLIMLFFCGIRERLPKMLFIACMLFLLSFVLIVPINYVTSSSPVHQTAVVLGKEAHRGSRSTHYYVTVNWQEELQKMNASKTFYSTVEEGDSIQICIRKSIFGMKIWRVHK